MLPDNYTVPKRQTQEFELFDEGLYNVKIDKMVLKKDVPSYNNPEETHDALTFHFVILDDGAFKNHVMFKSRVKILMAAGWDGGQASTLYKIYCAANKVKLSDDDAQLVTAAQINQLVGKTLQVLIENKPNSKGVIGSQITSYLVSKDTPVKVQETIAKPTTGGTVGGLSQHTVDVSKNMEVQDDGRVDVNDIPF